MVRTPDLLIGEFGVSPIGQTPPILGETVSGVSSTGIGTLYDLTGPEGLHLTLRDTAWNKGERDVVACDRHESPARFDTLIERLRLTVQD
ncbi:MAG: hypothetical protein ACLP50_33840 [Solirubrobacteraceae bacterium]